MQEDSPGQEWQTKKPFWADKWSEIGVWCWHVSRWLNRTCIRKRHHIIMNQWYLVRLGQKETILQPITVDMQWMRYTTYVQHYLPHSPNGFFIENMLHLC